MPVEGAVGAPIPTSANALYAEVARARLDAQLARAESIDTKASAMFTIGSTVLPITASLLTTGQGVFAGTTVSKYALVVGLAFYVALVVAIVATYRLARWDTRPELGQWREVTQRRTEDELQRWLGDACVEAYLGNVGRMERKARLAGAVLWFLALEVVCLTLAVLAPLR